MWELILQAILITGKLNTVITITDGDIDYKLK